MNSDLKADTAHCEAHHLSGWDSGLPAWVGESASFMSGSVAFFGRGNDIDVVVHVSDLAATSSDAEAAGYTHTGGAYDTDDRRSFRRGRHNLILCESGAYRRMQVAHEACMRLAAHGLLSHDKVHRVAIFRAVFDQRDTPAELAS